MALELHWCGLVAMTPRSSQDLPGREVPEKHWMYRFAKRYWFNDFGAYPAEATRRHAPAKTQPREMAGTP